jgi:hypothetical protein
MVPIDPTPDPILTLRRQTRRMALVGAAGCIMVLGIAAIPSRDRWMPPTWNPEERASAATRQRRPALNARPASTQQTADRERLYAAELWTPDPKPVIAEVPTPPPPPPRPTLKLQLLGIHSTGIDGTLVATLYDPETDRLAIVKSGDRVGLFDVDAVTIVGVDLRDAVGVRTLAVDSSPAASMLESRKRVPGRAGSNAPGKAAERGPR